MNSKLIFKLVKNQLVKQIDEKNPKLLILSVDFETDKCKLTTDTNQHYEIESPGWNPSQLKLLIANKLEGREARKLIISFYYLEKTKDYFTVFFADDTQETINLYKN